MSKQRIRNPNPSVIRAPFARRTEAEMALNVYDPRRYTYDHGREMRWGHWEWDAEGRRSFVLALDPAKPSRFDNMGEWVYTETEQSVIDDLDDWWGAHFLVGPRTPSDPPEEIFMLHTGFGNRYYQSMKALKRAGYSGEIVRYVKK